MSDLVSRSHFMFERRAHPRRKTLLSGKIEFFGRSTFECVIRNLSEGGAQLRCEHHVALPDVFDVVIEKSMARRSARVVWRIADRARLFDECADLRYPARRAPGRWRLSA